LPITGTGAGAGIGMAGTTNAGAALDEAGVTAGGTNRLVLFFGVLGTVSGRGMICGAADGGAIGAAFGAGGKAQPAGAVAAQPPQAGTASQQPLSRANRARILSKKLALLPHVSQVSHDAF